jgi:hypothetical protein
MNRILLVCIAILFMLAPAVSLRATSQHNYLMNSRLFTGNSGYANSWNPGFSGWNRAGSAYSSSWSPNFSGLNRNRGASAYATSWSPNFSGWQRRSIWKHNN